MPKISQWSRFKIKRYMVISVMSQTDRGLIVRYVPLLAAGGQCRHSFRHRRKCEDNESLLTTRTLLWIFQAYSFRETLMKCHTSKVLLYSSCRSFFVFFRSTAGRRQRTAAGGARVSPSQRETEKNHSVGFRRRSVSQSCFKYKDTRINNHGFQ